MNSLRRSPRRHHSGPDSSILTPMIDVVFQMLIYFVLTFEVPDRLSAMPVWRPVAPPVPDPVKDPPMNFGVRKGYYTWNGQPVALSQIDRILRRLADLNPEQNLVVTSSMDSTQRELVTLLDRIQLAGLKNLSLISVDAEPVGTP
ncbi:MAG: ExbD/TolR family protein [Kiritimatiellia bacterium]